ncbi:MAG: hypothetical protein ACOYVK_00785 [Bacillota bacterium]
MSGNGDSNVCLLWVIVLGLVFILGTGRGVAEPGEPAIIIP